MWWIKLPLWAICDSGGGRGHFWGQLKGAAFCNAPSCGKPSLTNNEGNAMGQYSKVDIDGRLMTVTINRPEIYNACHPMANEELVTAFDEFHANPELWVAIITGAGDKAFCAGNDLKYHAELQAKTGKRPNHPLKSFGRLANRFGLDNAVIAAVNGLAMGGGFETALACHII